MPDTSKEARAALQVADNAWQEEPQVPQDTAGTLWWATVAQPPAGERWLVVRTAQGEERARTTLARQVDAARKQWEKTLWHLSHQRFACKPDARTAWATQLKTCPDWLVVHAEIHALPKRQRPGRPRNDALPPTAWSGRSRPPSASMRRP